MTRRLGIHRTVVGLFFFVCLVGLSAGLSCPSVDPLNPAVPYGNRAPRVIVTSVTTPTGESSVLPGGTVGIGFSGEDGEDVAVVRVFASTSTNPTPAQELLILDGFAVGPGVGSGIANWNTTGAPTGFYYIYAEIDDRTYDPITGLGNRAVRSTFATPVEIAVPGTKPLTNPPKLEFVYPTVNLGLSSNDEVTTRYQYNDSDSPVRVTLLLDTDLIPTNDDINNPGDPLDPNTKIIILPSEAAKPTDPNYEGIRTNPRDLVATTLAEPWVLVEYRFTIDFQKIPKRSQPYYLRATITDETNRVHAYAPGSITVSALAEGTVDVGDLGFGLAGARFHGFSQGENLGSDFVSMDDLDQDGPGDFLIAGRFASPRNRYQSGAAYLIFGRRKTPFPPDTNDNGRPDVTGEGGQVVDFPAPPAYLPNPYDTQNVGRFGGVNSINSVGRFFRGTVYAMPAAHGDRTPPEELLDPTDPNNAVHLAARTAGLTSITRFDMNQDGISDVVFGLPFVSHALDSVDDDPADGCEGGGYIDGAPNSTRCNQTPPNDNLSGGPDEINQGLVVMVDGTTDIANSFRLFVDAGVAGQYDSPGHLDDEGVIRAGASEVPMGVRIRGAWYDNDWDQLLEGSDCCLAHVGAGCENTACSDLVCDYPGMSYCCSDGERGWDYLCAWMAMRFCSVCSAFGGYVYTSSSEYGRTVAVLPRVDNDSFDELLVSAPGFDPLDPAVDPGSAGLLDRDRGRVTVWWSNVLTGEGYFGGSVRSLPGYTQCPGGGCTEGTDYCCRARVVQPTSNDIWGQEPGDRLGYAAAAGDINQDGTSDISAGAPGADRNGRVDCGVAYIFAVPVGGFGDTDLASATFPRVEIVGENDYDRFGEVQTGVGDISGDSIADAAFAAEWYDGPNGLDSGYVGVVFGNRPITGEMGFSPAEVGTFVLPGIRFYGAAAGARAGHDIASAGDFNGDGVSDLLISSPGETRFVGGQLRRGVVYLIFGGNHLVNTTIGANTWFSLSQVGTSALPGIVFISRFAVGTLDEAPLETVGGIGDIDDDGFDDIILGAPLADFAYSVTQRRLDAGEAYIVYGSNHGSNRIP